ncbi:U3 small nucleolar ribonucleoprotein IMP3-like [Sarcoptes scabiei]|nr:U3 small nucleolar ribonucleoprotein IMP3-like [Sarcoptes scabiei]
MNTLSQNVYDLISKDFSNLTLDINGHYLLIDTGANLINRKFSRDLESILKRAEDVGVKKLIIPGTSINGNKEALRLTHLYPDQLYLIAGLHPDDVKQWSERFETLFKALIANSECVAIGIFRTNSNVDSKETQCDLFRKQIEIVCDLKQAGNNKPLILNDLEDLIGEEFLKILKENKNRLPNVLLNRCNGTSEQIRQYLELGFYLGLSGFISRMTPENGLIQLLEQRKIPLDRLSMEWINISLLSIESTNKFYSHFIFYVSILNRSSVRIKLSIQLAEHKKIETAIQSPRNFNTKIFELLGKVEMRSIHLEPNLFFIFSPKKKLKIGSKFEQIQLLSTERTV